MKKMGRPTTNPRTINLNLRLSKKEIENIEECARLLDINRVDAVIKGIELLKSTLVTNSQNTHFAE